MTPILPGQVWQSARKGEEHRRVMITEVRESGYVAGHTLGFPPRKVDIQERTLRSNYRLVKEGA